MAYGMNPQELAKVGQDVNKQGKGVDEQSIQAAMDRELTEDRKKQVGKFKARKDAARSKDAIQKAELKSNLVKAVVKSGVKVAGAAAKAKEGPTKSERISARADKAGERGNLVRQAKLQDKAAAVKSKEEIRDARKSTNLNQKVSNQKARAAKRAGSKRQQEALAEYDFKKRFGPNRGLGSPKPLSVKSTPVQAGSIFDQPGGAGKPKSAMDDLIAAQRRYDQGK